MDDDFFAKMSSLMDGLEAWELTNAPMEMIDACSKVVAEIDPELDLYRATTNGVVIANALDLIMTIAIRTLTDSNDPIVSSAFKDENTGSVLPELLAQYINATGPLFALYVTQVLLHAKAARSMVSDIENFLDEQ